MPLPDRPIGEGYPDGEYPTEGTFGYPIDPAYSGGGDGGPVPGPLWDASSWGESIDVPLPMTLTLISQTPGEDDGNGGLAQGWSPQTTVRWDGFGDLPTTYISPTEISVEITEAMRWDGTPGPTQMPNYWPHNGSTDAPAGGNFTWTDPAAPTVYQLDPLVIDSFPAPSDVTIEGTNFDAGSKVMVNKDVAQPDNWSLYAEDPARTFVDDTHLTWHVDAQEVTESTAWYVHILNPDGRRTMFATGLTISDTTP